MSVKIAIVDAVFSSYEEERGVLGKIGTKFDITQGETPEEIIKTVKDAVDYLAARE